MLNLSPGLTKEMEWSGVARDPEALKEGHSDYGSMVVVLEY